MKYLSLVLVLILCSCTEKTVPTSSVKKLEKKSEIKAELKAPIVLDKRIPNELVDYEGFMVTVVESGKLRQERRLTEQNFAEAIKTGKYVLLDCRSNKNFRLRHIKGAVNLPFSEITAAALAKIISSKEADILIYCNNNFKRSPISFASKAPVASLNLSTQTTLVAYGYKNVFELGPLLDVNKTILEFEGTETGQGKIVDMLESLAE